MPESNLEKKYLPRLLEEYRNVIRPQLQKEGKYGNVHATPKLIKIVVNMGLGVATSDSKIADKAAEELTIITGQKAKICRSRKPISNFKLREGQAIGCCVTLRKNIMYEFFDRLISIAMPRIRDFRGLSPNSFDGQGNYTFGLTEQSIFPELNLDRITRTQGMNITIHTSAKTDEQARSLFKAFGFPFKRQI